MVVDSRIHILRHRTLQSFSPPAVGTCREVAPFPLEAANDDGMSDDFGLHLLHLHLPGFHLDVHCLGQVFGGWEPAKLTNVVPRECLSLNKQLETEPTEPTEPNPLRATPGHLALPAQMSHVVISCTPASKIKQN